MATIYLPMNGYCFPLFQFQKRVLKKPYNPTELNFCKKSKGYLQLTYYRLSTSHISHVIVQQPLETKSERLRDSLKVTQLISSRVSDIQSHVLTIIPCWVLMEAEAIQMPSKITHIIGSVCDSSSPHYICPLRRLEEKKRKDFCVSLLSQILINRELFCNMNSIFP